MFRNSNRAAISPKNVGVGSVITGCSSASDKWLIVELVSAKPTPTISLLDLATYTLVPDFVVHVTDPNWLSESEYNNLTSKLSTITDYTRSDFSVTPEGIKTMVTSIR